MFAIKNLTAESVFTVEPWKYEVDIPEAVQSNKSAFRAWCSKPTTNNCHYSCAEGLDPMRRVSKDNQATQLHGLIADYDATISEEELARIPENCPTEFCPNWASLTYSSGGRLVWFFREPVTLHNAETTKLFLKIVAKRLKLSKFLPGFDDDAFFDVSRYYDRGRVWRQLCSDVIPRNMVWQWMYEAGNKRDWHGLAPSIPLDRVYEEVQKRWPGKWVGPFEDGSRGVRFWDAGADNDTAAVIRSTGVQCFTGDRGFVTWKEILGPRFVQDFEADRTGEVVSDFWWDGNHYWKKVNRRWQPIRTEDFKLELKVKHGLTPRIARGDTASEIDKVLFAVQDQKTVAGAMPFVHFPQGAITLNGTRYLNIATATPMSPATAHSGTWGDGFPWHARWLKGLFKDENPLQAFLAWWKRAYEGALACKPQSGQAIFLAGPVSVGKTYLSNVILSQSLGGHVDATGYLLGEERFTSHILASPLMTIDDSTPAADQRKRLRYSSTLKKIVANQTHLYEEKFHKAGQTVWLGRVVVTCNTDPESLRLLPSIEINIMDKISLFACHAADVVFDDKDTQMARVQQELPNLLAWLKSWTVPEKWVSTARFGVHSYHDPDLQEGALRTTSLFTFFELLADFLETYRLGVDKEQEGWSGSATRLHADLMAHNPEATRPYSPHYVGVLLGQMEQKGYKVSQEVLDDRRRNWHIQFGL